MSEEKELFIPDRVNCSKLPGLDGLRGICILFVLIGHFSFGSAFNSQSAISAIGVQIFFVISGFLITTLLLKEKIRNGSISLINFYIRRAYRILPVVLLFLLILFFLNKIFGLGLGNRSFITSIFFIRNMPLPGMGDLETGHLWSLSIEEQYYLLFPFLLRKLKVKTYKRLSVILIVSITTVSLCFYKNIGLFHASQVIHIVSLVFVNLFSISTAMILIGSFLSVIMFENPKLVDNPRIGPSLSLLLFPVAIAIRTPLSGLYVPFVSDVLFALLIGIVIILNLKNSAIQRKVFNNKILSYLGVLSYSIYIWQQLFTQYQPWRNLFPYADSILLNGILLVIVSNISYWLYEKKFLLIKERFHGQRGKVWMPNALNKANQDTSIN